MFSSYHCPTTIYIAGLLWKLHGQFFRHYRKNRTHAASLGPQSHMPSTLGNPSALPGSLCMPGTWITGRGTPGLANICLYALQLDPCPSHGQELLPVQGAQEGCWLGGQGTWLSPSFLLPWELLMKIPPKVSQPNLCSPNLDQLSLEPEVLMYKQKHVQI